MSQNETCDRWVPNRADLWCYGNGDLMIHTGCLRPLWFRDTTAWCPDCGALWIHQNSNEGWVWEGFFDEDGNRLE